MLGRCESRQMIRLVHGLKENEEFKFEKNTNVIENRTVFPVF